MCHQRVHNLSSILFANPFRVYFKFHHSIYVVVSCVTRKPSCSWQTRATLEIRVTGHSRSPKVTPFDSLHMQWRRCVVAKQCKCTTSLLLPCTASCTACILEWHKKTKKNCANKLQDYAIVSMQIETISVCKNAENTRFQSWFFIFWDHSPRLPNEEELQVPLPNPTGLRRSGASRVATPAPPSGPSDPRSALPANKADLWMHCLILWSGAATVHMVSYYRHIVTLCLKYTAWAMGQLRSRKGKKDIGVGDGGQRGMCLPSNKKSGKVLFEQISCKIRAFCWFSYIHFRQTCRPIAPKWTAATPFEKRGVDKKSEGNDRVGLKGVEGTRDSWGGEKDLFFCSPENFLWAPNRPWWKNMYDRRKQLPEINYYKQLVSHINM